ncbi:MAG: hypothetical protein RLZZ519_958, partial [Bacteroidota bacterium]|jgi:hypothetical protein
VPDLSVNGGNWLAKVGLDEAVAQQMCNLPKYICNVVGSSFENLCNQENEKSPHDYAVVKCPNHPRIRS